MPTMSSVYRPPPPRLSAFLPGYGVPVLLQVVPDCVAGLQVDGHTGEQSRCILFQRVVEMSADIMMPCLKRYAEKAAQQ